MNSTPTLPPTMDVVSLDDYIVGSLAGGLLIFVLNIFACKKI